MAQLNNGNGFPMVAKKIYPNDPCSCGSGKKAKKCCGTETTYYYSKLNDRQKSDLIKRKELEAKQNEPAII